MSKSQVLRERELSKAKYSDRLMVDSKFPNVAYEIKDNAVNVTIWQSAKPIQFAGTFVEIDSFADELKELVREWRDL